MGRFEKTDAGARIKPILKAVGVIAAVAAVAVCITVFLLHPKDKDPVLAPDHAIQEDGNAETIPNDNGEKMEKPEGGGSASITYAKEVDIDLQKGVADILFANPGKSNMDMILQIVIQDTVIAQSGTLKPGHQITVVELLDGAAGKLSPGIYEGKFVVLFYEPETGEKSIVNTEIPIAVTVK